MSARTFTLDEVRAAWMTCIKRPAVIVYDDLEAALLAAKPGVRTPNARINDLEAAVKNLAIRVSVLDGRKTPGQGDNGIAAIVPAEPSRPVTGEAYEDGEMKPPPLAPERLIMATPVATGKPDEAPLSRGDNAPLSAWLAVKANAVERWGYFMEADEIRVYGKEVASLEAKLAETESILRRASAELDEAAIVSDELDAMVEERDDLRAQLAWLLVRGIEVD